MKARLSLPVVMSFGAGYVDAMGFVALQGLFTSHVTGNFVTLGASLALGTSGVTAKLLALPMFCLVIVLARLLAHRLAGRLPVLRTMLAIQLALLALGAVLGVRLGPFPEGDAMPALITGMVLVAAMAIQNAVQRIHLASSPPTTIMTGTTTQIMLDLADLGLHQLPEARAVLEGRLGRMVAAVVSFGLGCAAAATAFVFIGKWCFAIPPVLGLAALLHPRSAGSAQT